MVNNEKISGVPSLKWYKFLIYADIPLGTLVDLILISMYTLSVMMDMSLFPSSSPISFMFVFMTLFFVFYRLISAILLTGRISAGPKTLIVMHAVQVAYMIPYLIFVLTSGVYVFATVTMIVTIAARIALVPINIIYFQKRKSVFCK